MIDIHAHLLPGLDDGAPDLDTALEMARLAVNDGIQGTVATPHVATGIYENSKECILQAVAVLRRELQARKIPLAIYPGAEYLLESDLPRRLQAGELLTINDNGRYLLVELPFDSVPVYMEQTIFEMMVQGVVPVLAHPERYRDMQKNPRLLQRLVEKGVLIQVTVGSLDGLFGNSAREAAWRFLRSGWVHFLASDAHSVRHRVPVLMQFLEKLKHRLDNDLIQLLVVKNPACLLKGQPVNKPEAIAISEAVPAGLWTRLFGKLKQKGHAPD